MLILKGRQIRLMLKVPEVYLEGGLPVAESGIAAPGLSRWILKPKKIASLV
ncbi:MAG: hypothetical protein AB1611_18325 [bacterium]